MFRVLHAEPTIPIALPILPMNILPYPRYPQKQLASERISALLEDRRIREQEEDAHRLGLSRQLEAASDKLQRIEETLRQTTKDYILGAPRCNQK